MQEHFLAIIQHPVFAKILNKNNVELVNHFFNFRNFHELKFWDLKHLFHVLEGASEMYVYKTMNWADLRYKI